MIANGNRVVVVPLAEAADSVATARQLPETGHLVQETLYAGATILRGAFAYQSKALKRD